MPAIFPGLFCQLRLEGRPRDSDFKPQEACTLQYSKFYYDIRSYGKTMG